MFLSLSLLQKAHVQQFVATEDALNKAAEARSMSQKLLMRLHGSGDVSSQLPNVGGTSQNVGSLRQFQVINLVGTWEVVMQDSKSPFKSINLVD